MKRNYKNKRTQTLQCVVIGIWASCMLAAASMAQAPEAIPTAGGVVVELVQVDPKFGIGEKAKDAKKQAREFLELRKLKEGFDQKNGIFVAIGSETFAVEGRKNGFDDARQWAFMLALLDAKQKLAESMGNHLQVEMAKMLKSGSVGQIALPETAQDLVFPKSLMDKAILILQDEVNKELNKRGLGTADAGQDVDATSKLESVNKNAEEVRKKSLDLVIQKNFQEAAALFSRAEIAGAQVYRMFESIEIGKKGSVAVILIYNTKSGELTRALLGKGKAPQEIPGESISAWAKALGETDLLYTQGAQMRTDENGEVVLVTFGQATPIREDQDLADVALDEAKDNANIAGRLFLGDMMTSQTDLQGGFDLKKFGELANTDEYKSAKKRLQTIRIASADLEMKGGSVVHEWSMKHPMSDVTTEGCVMVFSLSAAQAANALRDQMDANSGSKGGAGVTSRPALTLPANKNSTTQGAPSSGGPEGDLVIPVNGGAGAPGKF